MRRTGGLLLAAALVLTPAGRAGAANDGASGVGGGGAKPAGTKPGKAAPRSAKPGAGAARRSGANLVAFREAPFPLGDDLTIPGTGERFFSQDADGRRFHDAPRGGRLFEHPTYDDPRSLVVVPPRFDPSRPAAVVLFFHGNLATLERDVVARQRVIEQVERSHLNAVLVAPQLAVDALDSSPGRFYEPGFLDRYLGEAADWLANASRGRFTAAEAARWPLILVAYSGGYLATAFCLPEQSGSRRTVLGVVLLDALFGEEAKFAAWIARTRGTAFLVSAFSPASAALNDRLAGDVAGAPGLRVSRELPAALAGGDVVLRAAPGAGHNDFVTTAWTHDPLRDVLSRIALGGDRP